MKKPLMLILVFMFTQLLIVNCYSDSRNKVIGGFASYTNGYRNGYSLFDTESFHVYNSNGYIDGIYDTLKNMGKLKSNIPERLDIYGKLKEYYDAHPEELTQPIIDVFVKLYCSK